MIFLFLWLNSFSLPVWGFYGHSLINKLAVYTLPEEVLRWYKPHIQYIADHATDPDKRRYASKHEAVRHYIDLDHWGSKSFDHLPMTWDSMLAYNLILYQTVDKDTQYLLKPLPTEEWGISKEIKLRLDLVRKYYFAVYYEDQRKVPDSVIQQHFPEVSGNGNWYFNDAASEHGVVLYFLPTMLNRLTQAFADKDVKRILRLSTELGHYVGDACVPLHTTKNYNGQLTGQHGIHAFWESRIPELLAEDEFDFVVGTATYISNPAAYFRTIVLESHAYVSDVLRIEKEIRDSVPTYAQQCLEMRNQQSVFLPCPEYTKLYNTKMDNMVEKRFRRAIKSIGDCWYTAWVNAGQPDPLNLETPAIEEEVIVADPKVRVERGHE